jgi:(p)ppGpp synthase/HD superfamily hydrolase
MKTNNDSPTLVWDTTAQEALTQKALAFACEIHQGHFHKGSDVPYLSHLLGVASLVMEFEGSPLEATAAVLHDTLERVIKLEQPVAPFLNQLEADFGPELVDIVKGCSDCHQAPRPKWKARKAFYLEGLMTASPSVLLVSLADKLHNAQTTFWDLKKQGETAWTLLKGKKEGTLWYYGELSAEFHKRLASEKALFDAGEPSQMSPTRLKNLYYLLAIYDAHFRLIQEQARLGNI